MFTDKFDRYACDGDSITCEIDGIQFTARIEFDQFYGAPWEENDCHGIVSEWTRRDKDPGERILCSDRSWRRYYDFRGTIERAKREGWSIGEGTRGERAARAVESDFRALRSWCDAEWWYGSICIGAEFQGIDLGDYLACLGGIEVNYPDSDNSYLMEAANEILPEATEEAKNELDRIRAVIA